MTCARCPSWSATRRRRPSRTSLSLRPDEPRRPRARHGYYGELGNRGYVKAYLDILRSGKDAYRRILEHVRDKPGEPCLAHCAAGKYHAGVLVALALGVVGVPDKEVAEEYARTEIGLKD